ncbi:site-specific integrase [Nocardioides jensenii]|uniref:site-specific integrase n=1 Tax=Nocardioides jensenii TaxID=1843 RepID=UPI00082B30B1|nr:site-specific integrase [Nocardioides jensenii]
MAERRHTKQRALRPEAPARPRRQLAARQVITPSPSPAPAVPPRPHGNLDTATAEQIAGIADEIWPVVQSRSSERRIGLRHLLARLAEHPGETWQERWLASGLDAGITPVRDLFTMPSHREHAGHALKLLFCLRVIRPSLPAFRGNRFKHYFQDFEAAQVDPSLERFLALVDQTNTSLHYKRCARMDVAGALTTQGIELADLTAEGFLHHAVETRRGRYGAGYEHHIGHLAWQVLHHSGHFPPGVPATLRGAMRAPAMTPAQLVDSYDLANRDVTEMLTAYLTRRSHDLDHSTLRGLARDLCDLFWREIETINPAQTDLALSEETYQAWRAAVDVRRDGKPRLGASGIVTNVRALYLDIQGWATHEPEHWARWAAPCPISGRDGRARTQALRRAKERTDHRTRTLQPLLPVLVAAADQRRHHLAALLTAATDAVHGQRLVVDGRHYSRIFSAGDARHQRYHGAANVRVNDEQSGTTINLTDAEDAAFWTWACIETLRHTGVRNEEMLELSQLSIRQYVRPNGEVIALLVIAPSKSDRERVIPMTAELFHVIATIIRRLTRDRPTIALATRYDRHEHVTSEPQPFLFQRTIGQRTEVITPSALRTMLIRLSHSLAKQHPQLAKIRFTPHDFRRLFATDLANNGLPIHIGAALLGHLDVQTFHGYVTVFQEDVIRHYQAHLANRRAARPAADYRPVTDQEWGEFEEHFDNRKVELGQCGRPYATPCEHEHACIRCPMLLVDPKMIPRLDEIHTDLLARRAHAETEGWLGEIEGIDLTLRFLAEKRAETRRLADVDRGRDTVTVLGMPTIGVQA